MTPRQQWDARQELQRMAAELFYLDPDCPAVKTTIHAIVKARENNLTIEHFDTLKRRYSGHLRDFRDEI
jgi:hypothetical protein